MFLHGRNQRLGPPVLSSGKGRDIRANLKLPPTFSHGGGARLTFLVMTSILILLLYLPLLFCPGCPVCRLALTEARACLVPTTAVDASGQ